MLGAAVACGSDTNPDGSSKTGRSQADRNDPSDSQAGTSPVEPEVSQFEVIEDLAPGVRAERGEDLSEEFAAGNVDDTMYQFMDFVLQDVDQYWSGVWTTAGYPAPYVTYQFPEPGVRATYACSSDGYATDMTAAYCPLDDQIVFSQAMATQIWEGQFRTNEDPATGQASGDFSVAFAIAHEFAHSLQAELALVPRTEAEVLTRPYPVYKTELHADCWAGVWANSAYYEGQLEPGDVEEGIEAANLVGDYDFEDVTGHHGTPQQREDAFLTGYNSGVPSDCDPWLLEDYS